MHIHEYEWGFAMEKKQLKSSRCHCVNLRRAAQALTEYYDLAMKPYGITLNQYSIMQNIRRIEPCSVAELSRVLRLDRTTLVRNLKTLTERELVVDKKEAKNRDRKLECSLEGKEILEKAVPAWERTQKELEEYIGSSELKALTEALLKIEMLYADKERS